MRCKKTWMHYDKKMYTAAFGGPDLEKDVADTAAWMEHARDISIVMEDEVPVWIQLGTDKRLVTADEKTDMKTARLRRRNMRKSHKCIKISDHKQCTRSLLSLQESQRESKVRQITEALIVSRIHQKFQSIPDTLI